MAALTQWEKTHVEHVQRLLTQAETAIKKIEKKEKAVGFRDEWKNWLTFRYIVYDLYSVLDYTYYLLHCHFSHNGAPAPHESAIQCGFPYKAKGVKWSDTPGQNRGKQTFVEEKAKHLGGSNPPEEAVAISQFILELQPTVEVDPSGKESGSGPQVSGDAECLAMLHFYRNCVTHRNLIHFHPDTLWVELSEHNRHYKLVKKSEKQEGFNYYELQGQYFWIELPDIIEGKERHKPLLHELWILWHFARRTFTELLDLARIKLPDAAPPASKSSMPPRPAGAEQPLAKRVLRECEKEFLQAVAVEVIKRELRQKKVIHQDVVDKITKSHTDNEARGHLFDHLMVYGTVATLKVCCDVMMSEDYNGYQGMQDLGKKMKAMLEQEDMS